MFSSTKLTFNFCKKMDSLTFINQRNAQKCSKKQVVKGPPWRILFFGTDRFSLQSLKTLCAKLRTGTLISSLGIVTKKHSAVHYFGESEKLQLYYWPVNPLQVQSLYDIGMVVSFGNLIPKSLIESLPLGCINVHASLLPRWRGAAPIIHAILAGDNETGITIMRIHPHKFDVGEIVRQYRISIDKNETAEDLEKRLAVHGSDLLMECVRDLPKCVQMAIPQPEYGITYAPKVDPSISNVIWETSSAQYIYNLYRGVSHLYHLKTSWHGQVVKLRTLYLDPKNKELFSEGSSTESDDSQKSALDFLLNAKIENQELILTGKAIGDVGLCSYDKERRSLRVYCADGHQILISRIQVANKVMDARDFFNGFMTKKNKSEWKFISITK